MAPEPTGGAAALSRPRIGNLEALAGHGQSELRRRALEVAQAGLAACDAGNAAASAVSLGDEGIVVAGREYPLSETSRVVVVGAGKATFAIAAALEARLGDRIDAGGRLAKALEPPVKQARTRSSGPSGRTIASRRSATSALRSLGSG